jgi:hypothetical protein
MERWVAHGTTSFYHLSLARAAYADPTMASEDTDNPYAVAIARILTPILGPFTAKTAVKTFAKRVLDREADTLVAKDVAAVADALRPLLKTFVGAQKAEIIVLQIKHEAHR